MTLRLKADRSAFEGHERTLVDALFFDGRRETSTEDVRAHYQETGFDPVASIRPELEDRVRVLLEAGDAPRLIGLPGVVWYLACAGLLLDAWYRGETEAFLPLFVGIGALVVAGITRGAGVIFRSRMDWGRRAALLCLLPALAVAAATAVFLWLYVARGVVDLSLLTLIAIVGLALWVTYNAIRGLQSRISRTAVAMRKNLTAGREFFSAELRRPHAALRDEWYPWLLALGLGKEADDWSTRRVSTADAIGDSDGTPLPATRRRPVMERSRPVMDGAGLAADGPEAAVGERRGRLRPPAWRRRYQRRKPHPRTHHPVIPPGPVVVEGVRRRVLRRWRWRRLVIGTGDQKI